MSLQIGTRLGAYEIVSAIGAGGMGEVYRARDTRLNRDVAIKILPDILTQDPDHLARFEREAQLLASLNHPNIAHIYGVEESNGVRALVMELVPGDDLAKRLTAGALSIDEALPIALQISHGLEAAHEQGIIHRDLKPANIKVREDGTVKLLDFGLAKALDAGPSSAPALDNSPTITSPVGMTRQGVVLGTAAYMSPEQARGKMVDKRADIWAFGAVLYEMLTGRRVFAGETVSDTVAAVLKTEPDWTALPSTTPFLIRRLLRHCLDKDHRQRLGDIRDARIEVAEALSLPASEALSATPLQRARRSWIPWTAAAVSALIAVTFGSLWGFDQFARRETAAGAQPIRFTVAAPDGVNIASAPMVSPDGRHIVFAGTPTSGSGVTRATLWLRSLESLAARSLPGTEGASYPFWSPDSRRIGFFADGKLKTADVGGGLVGIVCDAPAGWGGTWNTTNIIVFAPTPLSGLYQVAAGGGVPVEVTKISPDQSFGHRFPQFLPDGRHFIFVAITNTGPHLWIASLERSVAKDIAPVDARASFAPPDTLLFVRGGRLIAQTFDLKRLELTGDAITVAEQVGFTLGGDATFSASGEGVAFRPIAPLLNVRLTWVDRRGSVTPVPLEPAAYADPAISPDGRYVALALRDGSGDHIWVYDLARDTIGKRTFEGANAFPIWTRDGQHLTFTRGFGFAGPLMRIRADGSAQPETIVSDAQQPGQKIATSWSADGTMLAFQSGRDVMVREADGTIKPALTAAAFEREARFAPDGRWLAYRSNETGRDEVYVQSYPPGGGKWQISTEGGAQPMWASNGRELFYKNANRLMVVPVELAPTFKPGAPRVLFEIPLPERSAGDPSRFGVAPDGKRFLVLTTDTAQSHTPPPPITVVLNWYGELKRRASQR